MTPNETIRLGLYRLLSSSGIAEWRQVNMQQLSGVTGCNDWNRLIESLKYFRSLGFIELQSIFKQPYPSVWGDRQFFYPSFEIKVVGKGFDDFARLETREKAEEKALSEKPLVFIDSAMMMRFSLDRTSQMQLAPSPQPMDTSPRTRPHLKACLGISSAPSIDVSDLSL